MANEAETGFVPALIEAQKRFLRVSANREKYLSGDLVGLKAPWNAEESMLMQYRIGTGVLVAAFGDMVANATENQQPGGNWGPPACLPPFTTMTELTRRYMETIAAVVKPVVELMDSRYPHICPRCSGPAYVGAVEVDCAGGCK
jgi:hypothetical protein